MSIKVFIILVMRVNIQTVNKYREKDKLFILFRFFILFCLKAFSGKRLMSSKVCGVYMFNCLHVQLFKRFNCSKGSKVQKVQRFKRLGFL